MYENDPTKRICNSFWSLMAIASFVGVLILLCLPSNPKEKEDRQREWGSYSAKSEGRRVLKNALRDPDSLQIIKESVVPTGAGHFDYCVSYRAKNGFGGYEEEVATFDVRP